MSAQTVLQIVQGVNALVSLAANVGISFQQLAQAQQKAALEGREFGKEDLEDLRNQVQASLNKLHDLLEDDR